MRRPDPDEMRPDPLEAETRLRRRDGRRLGMAFAGALMLHASLALAFVTWETEPVAPPGEMVITIDLAPAVASAATEPVAGQAAASAPQQQTPPEPQPEPEPVEPEPVVEEPPPLPEPVEEEVVKEEPPPPEPEAPEAEIAEPPPPAEKAEVVVAPKKEKPKAKPRPTPKPKPAAAAQAAAASSDRRADVGGSGAKASPSDLAKYIGRLRSALERSKRYPASANGASGTASLRFTVDRSGNVTGYTLTRSSGNAALDAATRAMIKSANLPPIPDGLPNSITVGVPVNFRVR